MQKKYFIGLEGPKDSPRLVAVKFSRPDCLPRRAEYKTARPPHHPAIGKEQRREISMGADFHDGVSSVPNTRSQTLDVMPNPLW